MHEFHLHVLQRASHNKMLHVGKSGGANSHSFSTGDRHTLYWRFFRPPDDRDSPSGMLYFHLVPCGRQEMANHPPHPPSKSERVKIYRICKTSHLTSLLKSLFTAILHLTCGFWGQTVQQEEINIPRLSLAITTIRYKVPKKKIHISWSPNYYMATRSSAICIKISFHRKPTHTFRVFDYH